MTDFLVWHYRQQILILRCVKMVQCLSEFGLVGFRQKARDMTNHTLYLHIGKCNANLQICTAFVRHNKFTCFDTTCKLHVCLQSKLVLAMLVWQ